MPARPHQRKPRHARQAKALYVREDLLLASVARQLGAQLMHDCAERAAVTVYCGPTT